MDCSKIVYKDNELVVEKEKLFGLKRFQELLNKDRFDIDCADEQVFRYFVEFMRSGNVPLEEVYQKMVLNFLKELGACPSILDRYRNIIQSRIMNGFIIHNKKSFSINIGCMVFHSSVFQDFFIVSPCEIFVIQGEYPEMVVQAFLDLIHYRISIPKVEILAGVLSLCQELGCHSLCILLNEKSPETIVSFILEKEQENIYDFSEIERHISKRIDQFLAIKEFGHISIPILTRIFGICTGEFSVSKLEPFIKECHKYHGNSIEMILSLIKFEKTSSLNELSYLLSLFPSQQTNSCFQSAITTIDKFIKEFNDLDEQYRQISQVLIEKNNELKLQRDKYLDLEKKSNDQLKAIQDEKAKVETTELLFKGEFKGVFDYLSQLQSGNPMQKGIVSVVPSSNNSDSQFHIHTILDGTERFFTKDEPNSWIEIDLMGYELSLVGYALFSIDFDSGDVHNKNWSIQISNDKKEYKTIDQRIDVLKMNKRSIKEYFECQTKSDYSRYIRIRSEGVNWLGNHHFGFQRIELFGYLRKSSNKK